MPTPVEVRDRVSDLSDVGRLVHLAMRKDAQDQREIEAELFTNFRTYYENELTAQAAALGCNRQGRLQAGAELTYLKDTSKLHAESIVLTYNRELAIQIEQIRAENKFANRYYYAARLVAWDADRAAWKDTQIALITYSTAIQAAKEAFHLNNPTPQAEAWFLPEEAVESECQELVAGNPHPVEDMYKHPTPIHMNCPHEWEIRPKEKLLPFECQELWMG